MSDKLAELYDNYNQLDSAKDITQVFISLLLIRLSRQSFVYILIKLIIN